MRSGLFHGQQGNTQPQSDLDVIKKDPVAIKEYFGSLYKVFTEIQEKIIGLDQNDLGLVPYCRQYNFMCKSIIEFIKNDPVEIKRYFDFLSQVDRKIQQEIVSLKKYDSRFVPLRQQQDDLRSHMMKVENKLPYGSLPKLA